MRLPFLVLLSLLSLLPPSNANSTPQQIAPSQKYSFSATQVFDTSGYYGTSNNVINYLAYSVTFPQPMNDSSYKSGLCIQQIYSQITNGAFNLTFLLDTKNPGSLIFDMWSNIMNNIQTMTIRYLIIDSNWGNFFFYWFQEPIFTSVSSSSPFTYSESISSINMTGGVKCFSCLSGFDVTASSSTNELSLIHSITVSSSSSFDGTLSSQSNTPISVAYISYNFLYYNLGEISAMPGRITQGSFSASNAGLLQYSDTSMILRQYNTLFGLSGFSINNEAFLSWSGTLTTNTSIAVTSNNNFLYFQFVYIILEENWCIEATPYLLIATSTCYDICPDGYYPNSVGMTCQACLYDCFQCTNATACSACNSTTDFRQMNTTTSRCTPLPGYYDDGLGNIVALPCSASCLTCVSTSTKCKSCNLGSYLSGTNCLSCTKTNCNNCTTSNNCFACASPYTLSSNSCVLNCSLVISNCSTCNPSPTVTCTLCLPGFFLNNTANTCEIICGDAILASTQGCDDGNTASGDGCSSTCTIQSAFFCSGTVGSQSSCSSCLLNCLNCTSSTTCSLCQPNYQFNPNSTTCDADCSVIANCNSCSTVSNVITCSSCIAGYMVDGSNSCLPVCGDGLLLGGQACDDGNTLNGDGCSDVCTVQPAYFCSGAPSVCNPCMQYCNSCTSSSDCSLCNALTMWTPSVPSCSANCSSITYCLTCQIAASSIQCLTCSGGYSVSSAANACVPICGDGHLAPEEQCDDGNLNSGDGCDSTCKVEQYYSCNVSTLTNASQCFLSGLNFSLVGITKSDGQNSGVMSFEPTPPNLPFYSSLNWTAIITTQNSNVTVTNAVYDPATNRVNVDFNYSSSIEAAQIQFGVNTAASSQLSGVAPFNVSVTGKADDNQALEYYSETDYSMGSIVKYLALAAGACAILFLVLGILGGRIVGLECSGVIQLAFISTLELQNLSPAFSSLQSLSWSLGYNRLSPYDNSSALARPFKSAQFFQKYVYNYNIMGAITLLPILAALVCKVASKRSTDKQRDQFWNLKAKLCIGQFTLYALLSFSYLGFLSLFIQLKYLSSSSMDYMGLGLGCLVAAVGLFYLFFYAQASSFYSQFKQKFESDGFSSRFYVFLILERMVVPAILVQMVDKTYGNAAVIGIYVLLGVLLLVKKPYKGDRQNYRPFANYLVVVMIQGVYLGVDLMQNPTGMLSLYGPFVVLGLLLVCVAYSAYALFKDLKQSLSQCGTSTSEQQQSAKLNGAQMKQFTAKFLNEQTKGILDQQGFYPANSPKNADSFTLDNEMTKRLNLSSVKEQLLSIKKVQLQNNVLDLSMQRSNLVSADEDMGQDI